MHGEDDRVRMLREGRVDQLLGVRLRRRQRLVGIRLDQARGIEDSLRQSVADLDSPLRERRLAFARLVAKDQAECSDVGPREVAQHQLDFEPSPAVRDFEVGLFGVDHPHVVLVSRLAVTADVRGDDRIAGQVRRRGVHGDDEQAGRAGEKLIDQLLRVALHRNLRRAWQRQRAGHQKENGS